MRFRGPLFFLALLLACSLRAQDPALDSLKRMLKEETTDTGRAILMGSMAEMINDDSTWKYYNSAALALAEKNIPTAKDKELRCFLRVKATAYNNLGFDETTRGDLSKALYYLSQSLQINQQIGNDHDIGYILNNIADIYETQGRVSKALEYYDKSMAMHEKSGNKRGVAQAYNNLGYIYSTQGELDKALEFYEKSYKLKKELDDRSGIAVSLSNIGYIYGQKKDAYKAMSYYMLALKTATEIDDKNRMALIYSNIGRIYQDKGDDDAALQNYLKGLRLSVEMNDADGISPYMYNVGSIYLHKGNTDSALWYGTRSMEEAKKLGSPDFIKQSAELLKDTYKAKGNTGKALEFAELYFRMHDSINSEETRKATYKQQLGYEYDKKEAMAKLEQEKKDLETASSIKRQRIISWSIGLGLFMVLVFSVFLYKRFVLTQRQKKIIEEQKHMVDEKNSEILASINYAKRLQDAILPPLKMVKEHLPDSFVLFRPKDIVAGDFYWMETVSGGRTQDIRQKSPDTYDPIPATILIAAADCTGHGVPGAMVSVVCSNALNRTVKEFHITDPGKILDKVRELVLETFERSESEVKDGMDISLCSFNPRTNELKWAGANNPLWIIRAGEEAITEIKPDKQPIGRSDRNTPFTTHSLHLKKGDSVIISTDGYADQFGGDKGKKFKYSHLKDTMLSLNSFSMEEQSIRLEKKLIEWQGDLEQVDDVLVIGFRV